MVHQTDALVPQVPVWIKPGWTMLHTPFPREQIFKLLRCRAAQHRLLARGLPLPSPLHANILETPMETADAGMPPQITTTSCPAHLVSGGQPLPCLLSLESATTS